MPRARATDCPRFVQAWRIVSLSSRAKLNLLPSEESLASICSVFVWDAVQRLRSILLSEPRLPMPSVMSNIALAMAITLCCWVLRHLQVRIFHSQLVDWLNRLERFWSNDGKSKSTINVYFKYLKAILNQARMDGVIKEVNFPFGRGRFEMPSAEGRKLALTLEQIKQLVTYTDGNEETEMYCDMWFFSYLCNGINFRDMLYLPIII